MSLSLLFFASALWSCGGGPPAASAPKQTEALGIKSLLVVPFHTASGRYEVGTALRCSMCGTVFVAGPVTAGDAVYMTEQLLSYLRSRSSYVLIPPGAGEGARSKIISNSLGMARRDLLVETGRKLQADAVVSGTLFRFRQRIGTGYSADTPASVAFSLYLIRVADGRMVWDGHFDQTQLPLSENLFRLSSFLKGGGAWLTAEELARQGMEKVMATFPRR